MARKAGLEAESDPDALAEKEPGRVSGRNWEGRKVRNGKRKDEGARISEGSRGSFLKLLEVCVV
jgi:hypothetical protein